jgi:DNA-binding NarL/FixJ family response regulator
MTWKLFLVEDHKMMRETLGKLLTRERDFAIAGEASSAEEALEKLDRSNADLVLVDISLPGMDGITLLQEIGERWPGLPCVLLSAHAESVYGTQARKNGARAYIDKRDVRKIVPTIRDVLAAGGHR